MPVSTFRPTTPSRRTASQLDYSGLTKKRPEKALTEPNPKSGGRNNNGRITSRYRGGGHKRLYRIIDFKRNKLEVTGTIKALEYDPNRSANLALVFYKDGEKRYILAPNGVAVGTQIVASPSADIQIGNALPLKNIPAGTLVHNVEMRPGAGGKMARSAGSSIQLVGFEKGYAQLRMPSGEIRIVQEGCWATIGQVGNQDHENVVLGKAGRSRWLGRKGHVRGVAMNPVDHPMGGGEGRTSGGGHPVSPWGWKTKGKKTRHNKSTDRFIMRRAKRKKR